MLASRPLWRRSSGDRRYVRIGGKWLYATDERLFADLPVPGARDVTLEELVTGVEPTRRRAWGPEVPAARLNEPELRWAAEIPSRSLRMWQGAWLLQIPPEQWEIHRYRVVGMYAPELRADALRRVALAERDRRAWARRRRELSQERAQLIAAAHTRFGASFGELSRATGLSRPRVQQIASTTDASSASPAPRALRDCLRRVRAAHDGLASAIETLHEAERFRQRRVIAALDDGFSLAAVAAALDVSRARVAELARAPVLA